jgi:hypothetical protein
MNSSIFIKFSKIRRKSGKFSPLGTRKEQKKLKIQISAKFAKLLAELSDNSVEFYHCKFVNNPHKKVYP